jgi:hypothetical protein
MKTRGSPLRRYTYKVNLRTYLPSAPFVLFVASLLISGGLIWGAIYIGQGKKPAILSIDDARPADPTLASKDTDHDGLPDWEEAVRGTDPNNADSDSDGTFDGDEVAQGRDPGKPGPNDSLTTKENQEFLNQLLNAASSTNITDDISQRLFVRYAAALNQGSSGDTQTQEQIVQEALARSKVVLHGKTYTTSDLRIVPDTKDNIHAFGNQAIEAIGRHPNASFVNGIGVFGEAVDENNTVAVAALPVLGREYGAMVTDLLQVPVPQSYANAYLQVVNAFSKASGAFEDMSLVAKDPVRALSGFANYVQMMLLSVNVLKDIGSRLLSGGILFNTSEAGSAWKALLAP